MNIRTAVVKDVDQIVALLANDKLGKQREDYRVPLPQRYHKAFSNIASDPNQELVVVETGKGQVIGTLQLSFIQYLTYQGGLRAQIEAVRVHEDYRGAGIGQRLFEWAIKRANEKGAHVVQLTTEKLGFVASHEGMKLHLF